MNNVLHMLLGGALVCLGILATALADRVRQLRITRSDSPGAAASVARHNLGSTRHPNPEASARSASKTPGSEDVIAALQSAGYKKAVATQAVIACSEQEQRSPESWMAAALRRCA